MRDSPELFAFLIFATEIDARPDKAEQIERTVAMFPGGGWEVPRLVDKEDSDFLLPRTQEESEARNQMLASLEAADRPTIRAKRGGPCTAR